MVDGSPVYVGSCIGGMELGVADDQFFKVGGCGSVLCVANQVGTGIGVGDAHSAEE